MYLVSLVMSLLRSDSLRRSSRTMHSTKCRCSGSDEDQFTFTEIHDRSDTTLASLSSPNIAKAIYHAHPQTIVTPDSPSRCPIVLASIRSLFRISLIQDSTMKQHCPNPLHQVNPTTKALCIFIPHIVPNLPFKASAHISIVRHFNVIVQESHPLPLFTAHKPQRQTTKLPVLSIQHLLDLHTLFNFFLRST